MCILHLGENGLEKYRLAKKWEQFKIVLLFMDHPVYNHRKRSFSNASILDSLHLPLAGLPALVGGVGWVLRSVPKLFGLWDTPSVSFQTLQAHMVCTRRALDTLKQSW